MLKILVIGDYGVGKTAIVRRFTEGKFSTNYKITIGAEFSLKSYCWDNYTQLNIQLWDIGGHERFGYMTRVYYKYASAAVIVFDLSRMGTFSSIEKWLTDIREKVMLPNGSPIPVVIFANKSDIARDLQLKDELDQLCNEDDVIAWYSTSAKDNVNIEEAMGQLVVRAMEHKLATQAELDATSSISLHSKVTETKGAKCCNYM